MGTSFEDLRVLKVPYSTQEHTRNMEIWVTDQELKVVYFPAPPVDGAQDNAWRIWTKAFKRYGSESRKYHHQHEVALSSQ